MPTLTEVQAISRTALFLRKRVSEAPVVCAGGKACLTRDAFAEAYAGPAREELPNSGGYRRKVRAGLLRGVYALRSWSGGAACPSGRREQPVRKAFAGNCALCGENGDACVCRLDFAEALPQ